MIRELHGKLQREYIVPLTEEICQPQFAGKWPRGVMISRARYRTNEPKPGKAGGQGTNKSVVRFTTFRSEAVTGRDCCLGVLHSKSRGGSESLTLCLSHRPSLPYCLSHLDKHFAPHLSFRFASRRVIANPSCLRAALHGAHLEMSATIRFPARSFSLDNACRWSRARFFLREPNHRHNHCR